MIKSAKCLECNTTFEYRLPYSTNKANPPAEKPFNFGSEDCMGNLYYIPICPECHSDSIETYD